jgi:hypothetical protein
LIYIAYLCIIAQYPELYRSISPLSTWDVITSPIQKQYKVLLSNDVNLILGRILQVCTDPFELAFISLLWAKQSINLYTNCNDPTTFPECSSHILDSSSNSRIYTRLLIAMPIKKATLYSYQCGTLHPYPVLDLTKKCEVIKASDIPVSAYDINGAACLL